MFPKGRVETVCPSVWEGTHEEEEEGGKGRGRGRRKKGDI